VARNIDKLPCARKSRIAFFTGRTDFRNGPCQRRTSATVQGARVELVDTMELPVIFGGRHRHGQEAIGVCRRDNSV